MQDLFECIFFLHFKEKIKAKSHLKQNHIVIKKKSSVHQWSTSFAPDFNAIVFIIQICTNSNVDSIRFQCIHDRHKTQVDCSSLTKKYSELF
jgi:hypothetical protein